MVDIRRSLFVSNLITWRIRRFKPLFTSSSLKLLEFCRRVFVFPSQFVLLSFPTCSPFLRWPIGTKQNYKTQNRNTKLKTESQNSKQNHKTWNKNAKLKTKSQNPKQKHKTQNTISKPKTESQNPKQKHKTQNRITKPKTETQNSKQKHKIKMETQNQKQKYKIDNRKKKKTVTQNSGLAMQVTKTDTCNTQRLNLMLSVKHGSFGKSLFFFPHCFCISIISICFR